MMHKKLDNDHFVVSRNIKGNRVTEYFTTEEKRHREDGPAMITIVNDPCNEYLEWWCNDKLIATFNRNKNLFLKSNNGKLTGLEKVEILDKWKGLERILTLSDLSLLDKPIEPNKEISLDNISKIRNQSLPITTTDSKPIMPK